jgi:LysM repeat protein
MIAGAMVVKSARYLAPLALSAVAVGVYAIVSSGLGSHPPAPARPATAHGGTGRVTHRLRPRYYTVKPGDTLSAISVRTHVSIPRLTALNSQISPNSLQTGQRLRLRR